MDLRMDFCCKVLGAVAVSAKELGKAENAEREHVEHEFTVNVGAVAIVSPVHLVDVHEDGAPQIEGRP